MYVIDSDRWGERVAFESLDAAEAEMARVAEGPIRLKLHAGIIYAHPRACVRGCVSTCHPERVGYLEGRDLSDE